VLTASLLTCSFISNRRSARLILRIAGLRYLPVLRMSARGAAHDAFELFLVGFTCTHSQSIVLENFQRLEIVGSSRYVAGELRHYRMHAARIVSDHAANRATIVSRRIGSKRKPMRRSMSAKIVEYDARTGGTEPFLRIDCDKVVEVFRHVQNDRNVATLARETRAAAA
jgi:hypothetical protein